MFWITVGFGAYSTTRFVDERSTKNLFFGHSRCPEWWYSDVELGY